MKQKNKAWKKEIVIWSFVFVLCIIFYTLLVSAYEENNTIISWSSSSGDQFLGYNITVNETIYLKNVTLAPGDGSLYIIVLNRSNGFDWKQLINSSVGAGVANFSSFPLYAGNVYGIMGFGNGASRTWKYKIGKSAELDSGRITWKQFISCGKDGVWGDETKWWDTTYGSIGYELTSTGTNTTNTTNKTKLVVFGDSITNSAGLIKSYGEYLNETLNYTVWNEGVSGQSSQELKDTYLPNCIGKGFQKSILLISNNDMNVAGGTTYKQHYDNLEYIASSMKNDSQQVLISTIPPCNRTGKYCDQIIDRNNIIRRVSYDLNLCYSDIYLTIFGNTTMPNASQFYDGDLHPNNITQSLMNISYFNAFNNCTIYNCNTSQTFMNCYNFTFIPPITYNQTETPVNFTCSPLSNSTIVCSWIGNAEYILFYRNNTNINNISGSLNIYSDTGLLPNTSYSHFIKFFNSSYFYNLSNSSSISINRTLENEAVTKNESISVIIDTDKISGELNMLWIVFFAIALLFFAILTQEFIFLALTGLMTLVISLYYAFRGENFYDYALFWIFLIISFGFIILGVTLMIIKHTKQEKDKDMYKDY